MKGKQQLFRDPDTAFHDPEELLERPDLTVSDKLRILRSWYTDLVEDQKATEENMSGADDEHGSTGARLMQVVAAIERLESQAGSRR